MRIVCLSDHRDLFRYNLGMGDDKDGELTRGPGCTEESETFAAEIVRIHVSHSIHLQPFSLLQPYIPVQHPAYCEVEIQWIF